MATVIKIKSSTVADKKPDASSLQPAELAINLTDQKLYSKDVGGTVFELGKGSNVPGGNTPPSDGNDSGDLFFDTTSNQLLYWDGSQWVPINAELALGDLSNVNVVGVSDNQVLAYDADSSSWVPVSAASLSVDVDLGYTPAADKGTVTNTAGDDAEIPLADGTDAGLSLNNFTKEEKDKLADVADDPSEYLKNGDPVSSLDNDAGYITLDEVPEVTGFVKLDDEGTEQSITGGGGLDVAGGIKSQFGTSSVQLGNVAPLNDWSCYPARPTTFYVRPTPPPPPAPDVEPVDPGFGVEVPTLSGGLIGSGGLIESGSFYSAGTTDIIDLEDE
jgi:hypothetical protein